MRRFLFWSLLLFFFSATVYYFFKDAVLHNLNKAQDFFKQDSSPEEELEAGLQTKLATPILETKAVMPQKLSEEPAMMPVGKWKLTSADKKNVRFFLLFEGGYSQEVDAATYQATAVSSLEPGSFIAVSGEGVPGPRKRSKSLLEALDDQLVK